MRKKDEIKLDALSQLNDDVIEKVTRKRNKLMGKNRRPIKMIVPMAACLAGVLVLGAILGVLIPMLTKQVPIYTGMSVSTTSPIAEVRTSPAKGYSYDSLLAKKPGEEPTPPKPVDDIAKSAFTVTGTDKDMYYAEPGQDIYITLHINNPDNFVILSFTLNGKVYSSYMFEEGSDMENIVLKYNVGNVEGIVEYTVDAIKYVDGKQIKDVLMNGERTVKVGVHTDKQPTVNASDIKVGIGSFAISASITDTLSLMSFETGKVYAGIFTEDELVTYKEITSLDGGRLEFDGLELAKDYRFAIVAAYDSLDGQGIALHTLYEYEFTTLDVVGLDNIVPTQSGVDFSVIWEDTFENKKLDKIELYRGGELVRELSGDATGISELLSNNEYEIVLYYTRDGVQESVRYTFKTLEKAMPSITFGSFDSSTSSITGSYTIVDADNVITSDVAVGIYLNGQLVNNVQNQNPSWNELYSNTEYVVKVSFAYNLNDGTGEHTYSLDKTVTTKPKLDVTSVNILNTSGIFEGDKIYLKVIIDNPDKIKIDSVVINGVICSVMGDATENMLNVEIVNDGQLGAGVIELSVEAINTNGYTYSESDKVSVEVFIHGNLTYKSIEFVDENLKTVYWGKPSDKVYALFTVDNPTGYEIVSITLDSGIILEDLIKVDDNRYYYSLEKLPSFSLSVTEISYVDPSNSDGPVIKLEVASSVDSPTFLMLGSDETRYISTVEDLAQITSGYYYEFTSDIDMTEVNWTPPDLYNVVINGNGYSIKNLSYVGTTKHENNGLLFNDLNEVVITDLHIKSANMIIDFKEGTNHLNFGILAGHLQAGIIMNCTVDKASSIMINLNSWALTRVGGIVGFSESLIINCVNRAYVSCQYEGAGDEAYLLIGGIVGDTYGLITDSINYGTIINDKGLSTGGIAGSIDSKLMNCINYGNVTGYKNVAGIAGGYGVKAIIIGCSNNGTITGKYKVGEILGYDPSGATIIDCISNGTVIIK